MRAHNRSLPSAIRRPVREREPKHSLTDDIRWHPGADRRPARDRSPAV